MGTLSVGFLSAPAKGKKRVGRLHCLPGKSHEHRSGAAIVVLGLVQ